nr:hypothetical protein [Tanacetum cinerariifolium]
ITYKQLYDSIKSSCIRSKEQCDDLNKQVNIKSVENSDLNASLQEKVLVITALKDILRKLKGKAVVDEDVILHPIDPELLKLDVAPLAPKLRNNRTAHSDYLKHTQKETATLREIVEHKRSLNPLNTSLDYACRKKNVKTVSSSNVVSNKPMLFSTRVNLSTIASGSQTSGNTKKDKIWQTPSSSKKNKLEACPRNVRSSLNNKNCDVKTKNTASVLNSKSNVNSDLQCVTCNGCLFSDNHDSYVLEFINTMNARVKSKSVKKPLKRKVWKPTGKVFTNIGYKWRLTGRTFTIVGNACPLTRITTTAKVPLRKPIVLESNPPTPVVTLVYSQKPKESRNNVPVGISHETSVARSPQQNGIVERGKLQPKADVGIFLGYALTNVDPPALEVITLIAKVVSLEPAESTGLPSSTKVDQDAPSPSKSQTTLETQPPVIPKDVEEDNHDIEVAHMGNDPFFGMPIPEVASVQSSSTDSIHIIMHPDHQISQHNSK